MLVEQGKLLQIKWDKALERNARIGVVNNKLHSFYSFAWYESFLVLKS